MKGGFRAGDFTVVTGIPGEGKTTLCRDFTLNFSQAGIPSLWFSYEMTLPELWESFKDMGASRDMISFAPAEINDDYDWLLKHIQKAILERGIKAVFIDTLGDVVRVQQKNQDAGNYATYLAQLCKDLRMFGIKNGLMTFAIAHAVKNTQSRSNETRNSDIANSNGIPAAATNIFHVWREGDNTMIKIGKSRRDGTKKDRRIKCDFVNNRLVPTNASNNPDDLW